MIPVLSLSIDLKRSSRPALVASVLVTFALVIVTAVVLILTAMDKMALRADNLDEQRVKQTAGGTLAVISEQMSSAISDYTAWDDAARAVYVDHDKDWLVQNYGAFTGASELFDTYFLIDPAGNADMAYKKGVSTSADYRAYFGPAIARMIKGLKDGLEGGAHQTTGFLQTADGLAIVGISAVRSSDDKLTVSADKVEFVVFARHLTPKVIDKLSRNYIIKGLSLAAVAPSDRPSAIIKDSDGASVGAFVWSETAPGTWSYLQVRPMVIAGLSILGLFFTGLLLFGTLLIRKLIKDERSARKLAKEDLLTGLVNRVGLFDELDAMADTARETHQHLILFYLDLDGFKEINDAYGHFIGDQLIKGVTAGLQGLLPDGAIFARIGGDEFAIAFLRDEPTKVCRRLETLVCGFFREPLMVAGRVAAVGASMGIAISISGQIKGEELLRRADMAMYRSKADRACRAVFYDNTMDEDREARASMAQDLKAALDANALYVVYQPVIDAKTRRIVGVEALVRWNREGYGMTAPDIFISVAENTGLIDRLGEFVMRTAFAAAANWKGINIAVNVSPAQLHDTAFVKKTATILKETGLSPDRAVIEITEGFFIRNPERAKHSINDLRRIGIRVALDDFGSGFSSIGYLRGFNFDRMKIDRSLTNALGTDARAGETLKATVALASSFNIPVTAEGIETDEEANFLMKCGCDELQGYLFSKPVSPAEITAMLSDQTQSSFVA
jgi:diguanylate cyclase (GGDEF)-like protein